MSLVNTRLFDYKVEIFINEELTERENDKLILVIKNLHSVTKLQSMYTDIFSSTKLLIQNKYDICIA